MWFCTDGPPHAIAWLHYFLVSGWVRGLSHLWQPTSVARQLLEGSSSHTLLKLSSSSFVKCLLTWLKYSIPNFILLHCFLKLAELTLNEENVTSFEKCKVSHLRRPYVCICLKKQREDPSADSLPFDTAPQELKQAKAGRQDLNNPVTWALTCVPRVCTSRKLELGARPGLGHRCWNVDVVCCSQLNAGPQSSTFYVGESSFLWLSLVLYLLS